MNNAGVFTWTEISFATVAFSIVQHKWSRRERLNVIEFWSLANGVSVVPFRQKDADRFVVPVHLNNSHFAQLFFFREKLLLQQRSIVYG